MAIDAAISWDLPAPVLVRHGMNSLYRCGDVVLRVGASTAPAAASHELVRWLLSHDIAAVPPIAGMTADVDGLAVSGWQAIETVERGIADWRSIGATVRRLHALDPADVPAGYPVPDPSSFPWWDFDAMIDDIVGDVDAAAHEALAATIERRAGWQAALRTDTVLCHGDVHPGNVLQAPAGSLLIDWDLLCVANPAWDHAMLSTYAERWGGDPGVERRFCDGYGAPLPDPELVRALGELRNVAATIMRVRAGRSDPAAATEAQRRLRYWRGDPDAPTWAAQ